MDEVGQILQAALVAAELPAIPTRLGTHIKQETSDIKP